MSSAPFAVWSADTGDEQPMGLGHLLAVGGELDIRSGPLERLDGGMDVSGAVIEDDDVGTGHGQSAPLVDGMPVTLASGATA